MPQLAKNDKKRSCKKPQNQQKPESNQLISNENHARSSFCKKPKKKKKFLLVKLKGLGCKDISLPASTPSIIRSAAEWENRQGRNKNQTRKLKASENRRNPGNNNVVVDVPDVCCAPPGIGIASDFAPRTRNAAAPRLDHRKHPREARRNEDGSRQDLTAILSGGVGSRTTPRSAAEIIEMLMSQQTLHTERILNRRDLYQQWRFNVEDMSYEELLDLSDNIGYVGTGLQEEEISSCLRILKASITNYKDWKCSICQEKCRRDEDIGMLDCGHYHHAQCIKQWLLRKNACPICKSAALRDKSG